MVRTEQRIMGVGILLPHPLIVQVVHIKILVALMFSASGLEWLWQV